MAFFHELIADLEHERDAYSRGGDYSVLLIDVPEEVLKFAPRKMRLQHQAAEDRIEQLETEIKQWQDRAGRAETRLQSLENRIQRIAEEYVYSGERSRELARRDEGCAAARDGLQRAVALTSKSLGPSRASEPSTDSLEPRADRI